MLALAFGLLRIHGAYQNEQKAALLRAAQMSAETDYRQRLAEEDHAKLKCSQAWAEYNLAEQDARLILIRRGEIAYLDAERKLLSIKPLCDGYHLSLDESMHVITDHLENEDAADRLRRVAAAERRYAIDQKLQTRHILHKAWATLAGATAEAPADWIKFLSENYPDIFR